VSKKKQAEKKRGRGKAGKDKIKTPKAPNPEVTRLPLASANMRIGLLGGSFNPPHAAHRAISLVALKRLGLDQVWWLVSPGNPLKDASTLASLKSRIEAARHMARHPRIAVTGFEAGTGSAYTIYLIAKLKRRFPGVNFVWLMGADNLAAFDRWRAWERIFATVPIAVFDRPGFRLKARASKAAQRFSAYQVDESDARGLARLVPPAWSIITHTLSPLSSTELRTKGGKTAKKRNARLKGKVKKPEKKAGKTPKKKAKRH
jgi:nicotinate-nucleotide adenylyltransferase